MHDYLSLSLNDETIKIAHLIVSDTTVKLVNVVKSEIRGLPEGDLPKVIQTLVASFNCRKPRAIWVVPSNLATTKNIEIPSKDPAEIKSIINLQAGRHTPFSREEILISFVNIGIYQTNYTKVLLVIVNRNSVKKQLSLLERAGLRIDQVLFAPETIARFYAKSLELNAEDVPVGIIDVGNQSTDFIVEFHGNVIACRSIPIGIKHIIATGTDARDKLIGELAKSVESYQSEDIDKLPVTYILSSDDVRIKEMEPLLKEKLKANVKIVPYLDHLDSAQAALLKIIQEYNDESFLDVIAPPSVAEGAVVDLMPEELRLQKSIEAQSKEIIKLGVFAILGLIMMCAIFLNKLYFKTTFLNKLTDNYSLNRQSVVTLEETASKTRIVKDYMASRMVALDVFKELYRVLPQEIYLENVELDEKGAVTIRGTSDSMSLVFSLVTDLEASGLFKGVKTKSTTAKKERGKDVAAFEIGFKLESAKDDEESASEDNADNKTDKKAAEKS